LLHTKLPPTARMRPTSEFAVVEVVS